MTRANGINQTLWNEVERDAGMAEIARLRRGELLKKIRSASERSFRDGLAARGLTVRYAEDLIRNFERSEALQ